MNQPVYIRLANAMGAAAASAGLNVPRLEPERLLQSAARRTGLENFGQPDFREGLGRLCEELSAHAQLSQIGRIAAHFNIVDHLSVRLALIDYRQRHPDVSRQKIAQPLFILGLPRTGTTILFELLAQDAQFRSPASWEVARPVPPPRVDTYASDSRIRSTDRLLALLEKLTPGFRAIHAIGARLPQECVYLLASNFVSEQFGYMYDVPAYRDWTLAEDMTDSYRWHAQFLQHLQTDFSAQHWLLKTPAHLAHLDALFRQYPDARVVWTHRRPLDAVASFSSLVTTLRKGFSANVDALAVGEYELQHSARIAELGIAARQELHEGQFFDASFQAICRDPLAVVREIYQHFGINLDGAAETRMHAYLAQRPRYLYGEHNYSWQQFGIDESAEKALFENYMDRYDQYT